MTAAEAVRTGDILALEKLLAADPSLVHAYVDGQRTLLHVVSDWPGHFPNGPATVALLVRHGANPNARFKDGKHEETPLHWAASSNDIGVLNALIVAGADIEATGAVIAGGTPIADAVAFAQWACARTWPNSEPKPISGKPLH